ncbi:hypothetical protein MCNS_06070 [Mycobacterium conspicuum]|uniref:Uncharacterized protein n=1 Tax=Mycobacterium conspicuum TaxID=44010 RepID=A0A7I7Y8A1_9MYCO|nr:hypothetical protein MCNS_06070 [Mycobacterium conspicuum]
MTMRGLLRFFGGAGGVTGGTSSVGGGGASEGFVGAGSAVVVASALIGHHRPGRKAPRGEMLANACVDRAAKDEYPRPIWPYVTVWPSLVNLVAFSRVSYAAEADVRGRGVLRLR